jgi:hypothetical protein
VEKANDLIVARRQKRKQQGRLWKFSRVRYDDEGGGGLSSLLAILIELLLRR